MVLVKQQRAERRAVIKRTALLVADFDALDAIRTVCGLGSASEALRWAVEQQDRRDRVYAPGGRGAARLPAETFGALTREEYARLTGEVLASVNPGIAGRRPAKDVPEGRKLRQWSYCSNADVDAALDRVAAVWAIPRIYDTIRFCIRVHAGVCGFAPAGGW